MGKRSRTGALGVLAMALVSAVMGCTLLLGVDDLQYLGPDGAADVATTDSGDGGPPTEAAATDAGCEAAVATDPKNCGACGHDCLGGACDAGVCQPVLLTTGSNLTALASDGTILYLRDNVAIHSCPVDGCADAGAVFAAASLGVNSSVRLTTSRVVWNEGPHAYWCPKSGCAAPADYLVANTNNVVALWVSDYLFYVTQGGSIGPYPYVVGKCPLGGGACTQIGYGASDSVSGVTGLGLDVYWIVSGSPAEVRHCQGSCPPDASTGSTTALSNPTDLWADGNALWVSYVAGTTGGVARLRPDLTGITPFVANSPYVSRIVKDGADLYYLEANQRKVVQCAMPDDAGACNPVVVGQTATNFQDVAIDSAAVYWIEGFKNVWKRAR